MNNTNRNRRPIEPLHDFSIAPEPVCLQSNLDLTINHEGQEHLLKADIFLGFLPKPRVSIKPRCSSEPFPYWPLNLPESPEDTYFYLDGKKIDAFASRVEIIDNNAELTIRPKKEPFILINDKESCKTKRTIFYLFNFPEFKGTQSTTKETAGKNYQEASKPNLLVLQDSHWATTIQELASSQEAFKKIKEEGGCHLTHVAELSKVDKEPYSYEEFNHYIELLSAFLSFVQGSRFWPVCPTGLDDSNNKTWSEWSSPGPASSPVFSWFSKYKPVHAEQLFPLFSQFWQSSEEWNKTLRAAIYWYNQANLTGKGLGIDSSIIFAQTALERLSYHYLVNHKKSISKNGFNKIRASDRFRIFLSSLHIPLETPEHAKALKEVGFKNRWADAPHALTEIRNSLVHPEPRNSQLLKVDHYREARMIFLWYLELSILALCGYNGYYVNSFRRNNSCTEEVPWNASKENG